MLTEKEIEEISKAKEMANVTPQGAVGSLRYYLNILDQQGEVKIPSPDGEGIYTVRLNPKYQTYGVPELIFKAKDPASRYGDMFGGSYCRNNEGRNILWYPKGLGYRGGLLNYNEEKGRPEMIRLGAMIIGIILSGRKIYQMRCGQSISAADNNFN